MAQVDDQGVAGAWGLAQGQGPAQASDGSGGCGWEETQGGMDGGGGGQQQVCDGGWVGAFGISLDDEHYCISISCV